MKRRRTLERAIVLSLILSSGVYSTAWAYITPTINADGKLIIEANQTVGTEFDVDGKKYDLKDYENVEIHFKAEGNQNRPLGVFSARYDLDKTNITVYVEGTETSNNNDSLHLSNHYPHFYVNDYKVYVNAASSDALNLSRDITTDTDVIINGNLTAEVMDGNGIRANASINGDFKAFIKVEGDTNITINADAGGQVLLPTAIWAGSDENWLLGQKSKGKGEIYLNGDTNITLNGKGNYGILTGQNGYVEVNDLNIQANKKNSVGIGATNLNITYMVGTSDNKYGSMVVLNGKENIINVAGDEGFAIYAVGEDINGNSNTVKSGKNGIGGLNIIGNVRATESGLIDLTIINKTSDVTIEGNISGRKNGQVKLDILNSASFTGNIETEDNGQANFNINGGLSMNGNIIAETGSVIDLSINGDKQNYLQGDIIAFGKSDDKNASINLTTNAAIAYQGDALAANGGVVDVSLGDGSSWAGRADDYREANNNYWFEDNKGNFDHKFSDDITSSGTVNVNMGNGSIWNVTGQSWVTDLKSDNGLIIMDGDGTGGYALHVGNIEGSNTFIMNVRPGETGDMLYVKDGTTAQQNLVINNADEVLQNMNVGDAVRFATVANAGMGFEDGEFADNQVQTFGRSTRISDAGVFNVDFDIKYNDYNEAMTGEVAESDSEYNGEAFSETKPGDSYVDYVYGAENAQNIYIVRTQNSADNVSDAGKTIINMSRANYKNAIYMDRLNKRMGEMRYINGEEGQGMWVRLRHDRIGQSGDFRIMNTMYELGYDVKQPADNGEHRLGFAVDYMRGSTNYNDIIGKGETKRYGLWLYDTWLGDKGHYADYIVKWGHLANDFDITAKTTGENITGDYSNNVFSVSAEYGKKNELGNNWYFEPQVQAQLARVTGADYVTTQGSKVSVDGINSLIGRAGFRIGRDMDENSTIYLKADMLHEFLGDQTITATDATGTLREEFENEGTWYDVGLGFAARTGHNSYAFLDVERSFGNDNDETYQINAGVQWSF